MMPFRINIKYTNIYKKSYDQILNDHCIYFIEIEKTEITELKKMLNEEKRKVQDLQCEIQKLTSVESYSIKSFKDVGSQFNYMTSMTGK